MPLTPQIAACLYTGLATDTGCFRFTSTTARTHRMAARLIEAGADIGRLNELLFECRSRSRIEAEREALESLGILLRRPLCHDLPDPRPDPADRRGQRRAGGPDQPAPLH